MVTPEEAEEWVQRQMRLYADMARNLAETIPQIRAAGRDEWADDYQRILDKMCGRDDPQA